MRLAIGTITIVTGLLVTIGLTMLHSIGMHHRYGLGFFQQQCVWLVVGLAGCLLAASVDYRKTRALAWVLLIVIATLLVLARIPPIGRPINGAWRWIQAGPVRIQPSEFAKVALIMAIAAYAHACRRRMPQFLFGLVIPGTMVVGLLGLVLLGKDLGTTALLAMLSGCLLFAAGTRLRHLVPLTLAGALVLGGYLRSDPVRWRRIDAFLHPEKYSQTISVQAIESKIAIGSGGILGRGLGNGVQKSGFVPEQQTDFILSVIGEELGLRVTMAMLVAYLAFGMAAISISRRAGDTYGSIIACGVGLVVPFQAAINMAVNTDSVPNKGLALPFVSYGGSCLVAMLVLVGLLINVAWHSPREEEQAFLPDGDDREAAGLQNA